MAGVHERPALEGPGSGPGQRQERCQRIRARGTSSTGWRRPSRGHRKTRRVSTGLAPIWASVPAVDPTIAAAWITGGVGALGIAGTVVTAIVGSRNTRRATEATIAAGTATTAATLTAARDDRLWEKRCAAYEETLTALLHRRMQRRHDLRGFRWDEATEEQLKAHFDNYDPPGWFEARGRLGAYASDAVLDALEAASLAHSEVRARYAHRDALREQIRLAQESGRPQAAPDGQTMLDAHRQIDPALQEAEVKDELLIKLMRDELRSKPGAAALPAAVPVRRRRFWHRRQRATVPPLR